MENPCIFHLNTREITTADYRRNLCVLPPETYFAAPP